MDRLLKNEVCPSEDLDSIPDREVIRDEFENGNVKWASFISSRVVSIPRVLTAIIPTFRSYTVIKVDLAGREDIKNLLEEIKTVKIYV